MVFDARWMLRVVSLIGLFVLVGLCYALSKHRKAVSWRLVGWGLLIQAVLGGVFLWWDAGNAWLFSAGEAVEAFLKLSARGSEFVFGVLGAGKPLPVDLPVTVPLQPQKWINAQVVVNASISQSYVFDLGGIIHVLT